MLLVFVVEMIGVWCVVEIGMYIGYSLIVMVFVM